MNNKNYFPENVFKFCPVCGSNKFLIKGKNYFQCDDCGFVWYFNQISAVMALIRNDKGELLMTIRGQDPGKGELDFPGGFVEIGENLEQALIREIKEELNLDVIKTKYFGSFPNQYLYKGIVYFPLDTVFECEVENFEGIKAMDDASDYVFINPKEVDTTKIISKSVVAVIKKIS